MKIGIPKHGNFGHGVDDPGKYLQYQVQILYELLPSTQWVHLAAILTVFGLLFKYLDLYNLLIWLGFVSSILVSRIWIAKRYQLAKKVPESAEYWFNWFLIGTTLYGIMWSATAILLVPSEGPYMSAITALILCSLAAGGVAVSSVSLKVYFAYSVSIVFPYAAFLIATNQNVHALVGWLSIAFSVVIMIVAMHVNEFFSDLIRLQLKANFFRKELENENLKRQFAEKALLNNTLEEELAELIRQQSHKLRSNKELSKLSKRDKEETENLYNNYMEILAKTIKSQLVNALEYMKELNESPLPLKQSNIAGLVEKILQSMYNAIHKLSDTEISYEELINYDPAVIEKVNVRYLLNELSDSLPLALKAKYITLNRHYGKDIPHKLYGNKKALTQILNELLINAEKFMDGGVIDITVNVNSDLGDRQQLSFVIEDTGKGLSKDIIDYIQSEADEDEYTGSGLARVKYLVTDAGGTLSASSVAGVGSNIEFTFTFFKNDPGEIVNQDYIEAEREDQDYSA